MYHFRNYYCLKKVASVLRFCPHQRALKQSLVLSLYINYFHKNCFRKNRSVIKRSTDSTTSTMSRQAISQASTTS